MKKEKYSIGRGLGKFFAITIIAALASLIGGAVYENHQADEASAKVDALKFDLVENQISNNVAVVESIKNEIAELSAKAVHHEGNKDLFTLLLVTAFAVPAIHSMRLTGTLGLHKPRYMVPELDDYLSFAGYKLWKYLMGTADINAATIEELKAGRLRIRSFTASIKSTITSMTGNQVLFDASVIQKQGRIPEILNGGKLPKSTNAALSHVRMSYATDATATVPEADVDYTAVVTAWPVALAQGETLISQDIVKERFENRFAGSQANGFQSAVESDGFEFDSPLILEQETVIKIEQRFSAGQSISGTNNHFLCYDFTGAIITRKY